MRYTKQVDLGIYGARWGCLATCLINVGEYVARIKFDKKDLCYILGKWLLDGSVLLCNYKNHERLGMDDMLSWSAKDNPEFHFWVRNREEALRVILEYLQIPISTFKSYLVIREYKTKVGSHFVLIPMNSDIINPDPDIDLHGLKVLNQKVVRV